MSQTNSLAVLFFAIFANAQDGYYWREYMGWVLEDSFVGGEDTFGNKIYIGQAYIRYVGLLLGRVNPRETYLFGAKSGGVVVGKYIKVLCGAPGDFYWMPVTTQNVKSQIADKHAVIGGHEDSSGYLNIGRIKQNSEYKIGKIDLFVENPHFYYPDNGQEFRKTSFEILMFNGTLP